MTEPLKEAFDFASRLPEEEQDAVAEWLLAELASEEEWRERFAKTQDALYGLAQEALKDAGKKRSEWLDDSCRDAQAHK